MAEEFKKQCAQHAELCPDFEYDIKSVNLKDKKEVAEIMKKIDEIDHLVCTCPIHGGFYSFDNNSISDIFDIFDFFLMSRQI